MIDNNVIADPLRIANSFLKRFIGLMGKKSMPDNEGLLIRPCNQVHTFHMKFCIDVVFLSDDGTVLFINESLNRNSISPKIKGCCQVMELRSGTVQKTGLKTGDTLRMTQVNK